MAKSKTVKSKYFSVTAKVKSQTADTATIEWSWSRLKGYFGYCNSTEALVIKGANGYKNHLGIPKKWDSKWGTRSKKLTDDKSHKVVDKWGSLKGICSDGKSYTETVTLHKGDRRATTAEIKVGIEGTKAEKSNWEALVTLKIATAEIKDPENVSDIQIVINTTEENILSVEENMLSVEPSKVQCSIFLTYNPNEYYTATLYKQIPDSDIKTVIATENKSSRPGYVGKEYTFIDTNSVMKNLYNTIFIVEIKGKDGKVYVTKKIGPIKYGSYNIPDSLEIYCKTEDGIKNITELYFKNVNNKRVPYVYAKIDGKIVEIKPTE